jgi:M6 family metalloprotease-like protein
MEAFARKLRSSLVMAIAALLLFSGAETAWAVKANPKPVTYRQPDGTPVTVRMIGDERIVFVEDGDGNTLVKDDTGWWVLADPASHKSEQLKPTKLRAGKDNAPAGWQKHVRPAIDVAKLPGPPFAQQDDGSIGELFRKNRSASRAMGGSRFGVAATNATSLTPTTVPVLVVLVEFSDWKHTTGADTPIAGEPGYNPIPGQPNNAATWQTLFGDPNVPGGLNHFYKEATYGRLQWDVKVAQRGKGQSGTGTLVNDGWYANPNTMGYWGKAAKGTFGACDEDKGTSAGGIRDLITWAVQQADADVDFSVYDKDGNGSISDAELMIFVIHAREGQEYYGSGCDGSDPGNQHIWSHKWNMRVNVAVDGKTIPTNHIYAIEPEFNPEFNTSVTPWAVTDKFFGVGVYAHEALHTLGAPDIYDTDYDATPAGDWDLMDNGSYNGARSGTHPSHMGGPLKQDIKLNADTDANSYGFILESEIRNVSADGAQTVMAAGGSSPDGVLSRIQAPANANEWFLIENRASAGYYERYLPEFGLVIWHRDRAVSGSSNSTYPYQANVLRKGWANTATGLQTDVQSAAFSADDKQTTFNATTDPSNKLNNGTASGLKNVACISAEATAMTYAYGTLAGSNVAYSGSTISGGDGDDWLDFGESATLTVRLTNGCAGTAASNVSLSVSSADATVGAASASSISIAAGATAEVSFPVALNCSSCQRIDFNYALSVNGTTTNGAFVKDTNRGYLWFDDGDTQAKPGWTSQPSPNFIPSACTTVSRHGDWSLVAHPFDPKGNSYRAPVQASGLTYANPDEVWVSPNIAIPAGTNLRGLRFKVGYEIPCPNYTRARVWTSTNNGASWVRNESFYRDGGDLSWEDVTADLSSLAGATQIRFMFAIYTYTCQTGCTSTRGMYVDDIGLVIDQVTSGPSDTIAPTTAITAPAAGSTVSGTTTVSASATDNVGVTKVEFYLDGVLASTDTSSPYSWSWNTSTASNGSHTLSSRAYDAANNSGNSVGVSVTVSNAGDTTAPTTAITAPANGATVSGTTNVTASASDNVGVTKVEFYLDGVLASTSTAAPYAWSWNTATAVNGSHTLSSKAYDAANNAGSSATISVTVNNGTADVVPPVISGVTSRKINNSSFEIRWTTNEPATSVVILNGTTYADSDPALVTSHVRTFSGAKRGQTYTYYVQSTDAAGNTSQAGPFTHQN